MQTTDLKFKIPPSLSLKANNYFFLNEYLQIWDTTAGLHFKTKLLAPTGAQEVAILSVCASLSSNNEF